MYDKSKELLHVSRSVRKDIHSLGGSSDVLAVALIQEVDQERLSCLIQNGYAPVIVKLLRAVQTVTSPFSLSKKQVFER